MTQIGTVLRQNCVKSSEQTFSGTKKVCQKTCVTRVVNDGVHRQPSFYRPSIWTTSPSKRCANLRCAAGSMSYAMLCTEPSQNTI